MVMQQKSLPPLYSSQLRTQEQIDEASFTSASFKRGAIPSQHSSTAAHSAAHGIYTQNTHMKLASANTNRM